jgi:hypothetical protein
MSKVSSFVVITVAVGLVVGFAAFFAAQRSAPSSAAVSLAGVKAVVYKTPTCGCCGAHADVLVASGMEVTLVDLALDQLMLRRVELGVPMGALSCHTTVVEGYAVEGHVPLEAIAKLLAERPDLDGIALPGMPPGSPGMGGVKQAPFEIDGFKDGVLEPFVRL